VCSITCIENFSVAHELGHLLGCRHNPEADDTTSTAHGRIIFGADPSNTSYPDGARTIMAYSVKNETRVNYWSNPDVQFLGHPTGTAKYQDCAAQIRQRAPIVAKWASAKSGTRRQVNSDKQVEATVASSSGAHGAELSSLPRLLGNEVPPALHAAKASSNDSATVLV